MNRFATMQIFAGEVTGAAILVLFGVGVCTVLPLSGRLINPALAAIPGGHLQTRLLTLPGACRPPEALQYFGSG